MMNTSNLDKDIADGDLVVCEDGLGFAPSG